MRRQDSDEVAGKESTGHQADVLMRVTPRELAALLLGAVLLTWWNSIESADLVLRARSSSHSRREDAFDGIGEAGAAEEDAVEEDAVEEERGDEEPYGGGKFVPLTDVDALHGRFKTSGRLHLPTSGVIAEYREALHHIEREISFWAHTTDRSVYFWGTRYFFLLYFKIYSKAFQAIGFKVRRRPAHGESSTMNTLDLAKVQGSALVCLSHSNTGCYKTAQSHHGVRRYQRVNRLIYLRDVLWDKAAFCRTIRNGTRDDARLAPYTFPCWILPDEKQALHSFARNAPSETFIAKPAGEGAGKGIKVVEGLSGLRSLADYRTPHLVQTYLRNPHLINDHKWDIRSFVLVSSTVPMRVYIYDRGIVRFASSKYSAGAKNGGKKTQYLTNTHISKRYGGKSTNVTSLTWSFSDLHRHMDEAGESYDDLLLKMRAAVASVFLSGEYVWRHKFDRQREQCVNCYQILGVDIIVSADGNPFVIEVNGQPNLLTTGDKTDHYSTTKWLMVRDMIALIHNEDTAPDLLLQYLEGVDADLLKQLTKREWVYLIEYINERRNLGGFLPVYPAGPVQHVHDAFFDVRRLKPDPPARLALHRVLAHIEAAYPLR